MTGANKRGRFETIKRDSVIIESIHPQGKNKTAMNQFLIEIINRPVHITTFKTFIFCLGIVVLASLFLHSIHRIRHKYYLASSPKEETHTPELMLSMFTGLFCLTGLLVMLSALLHN